MIWKNCNVFISNQKNIPLQWSDVMNGQIGDVQVFVTDSKIRAELHLSRYGYDCVLVCGKKILLIWKKKN